MDSLFTDKDQFKLLELAINGANKNKIKQLITKYPEFIDELDRLANTRRTGGKDSLLWKISELGIKISGETGQKLESAIDSLKSREDKEDYLINAKDLRDEINGKNTDDERIAELSKTPNILKGLAGLGCITEINELAFKGLVSEDIKPHLETALGVIQNREDPYPIEDKLDIKQIEILEQAGVSKNRIHAFLKAIIDQSINEYFHNPSGIMEHDFQLENLSFLGKTLPDNYLKNKLTDLAVTLKQDELYNLQGVSDDDLPDGATKAEMLDWAKNHTSIPEILHGLLEIKEKEVFSKILNGELNNRNKKDGYIDGEVTDVTIEKAIPVTRRLGN